MLNLDKRLYDDIRKLKIPKEYSEKVDKTLDALSDNEAISKRKKGKMGKYLIKIAACLALLTTLGVVTELKADAGIFTIFKQTIMDIFEKDGEETPEELGIESQETIVADKRDLRVELSEIVADRQNLYVLIHVIAPTDIEFKDDISFDYFAFVKGKNYNQENLISGITDCFLLEISEESKNEATYIASITTPDDIMEDSEVTLFLQNLVKNTDEKEPEVLVEGMWSFNFKVAYTIEEDAVIEFEGTEEMEYQLLGKTAQILNVRLTPLSVEICSDVTEVTYDVLNVSDVTKRISLLMIDGKEIVLMSQDVGEVLESGAMGSVSYEDVDEKIHQTLLFEFENTIDVGKVLGMYIEELYIPIK